VLAYPILTNNYQRNKLIKSLRSTQTSSRDSFKRGIPAAKRSKKGTGPKIWVVMVRGGIKILSPNKTIGEINHHTVNKIPIEAVGPLKLLKLSSLEVSPLNRNHQPKTKNQVRRKKSLLNVIRHFPKPGPWTNSN
jgi:hypothetical protein